MSESAPLPRPRQVTVAGVAAIVTCALFVVALFDAMARVRSVEMRTDLADLLSRPPGNGLGIDVEQAVAILRGVVLFNGAVAAAATVLAVYTLQRHNGARIGLSVAAGVLLFTAPVSGGVLPVLIAVAATMLWSAPARDWFAGRPPRPTPAPGPRTPAPGPRADASAAAERSSWPPPVAAQRLDRPTGPDEAPEPATPQPQPGPAEAGPPPAPHAQPGPHPEPGPAAYPFGSPAPHGFGQPPSTVPPLGPPPGGRPTPITIAAWITWVFSGLTAVSYLAVLVSLVTMRDDILRELRKNQEVTRLQLSDRELIAGIWVVGVVVLLWALAAMVLAFLAYRRVGWARIGLAVSAGITGLVAITAYRAGLLHAVAAFTTVWLLFRPACNAWFRGRTSGGSPYDGPPRQPPPPPPSEPNPPKNVW